jgi:hypothetical protein
MDCSCQDLMSALSSKKIQSDQDIDSKNLTLLQVCLLFKHFTCPIFHGSKCSLFSMCICVLFIYLTISLFTFMLRQLKQEMQSPNLFIQACLNGLYNKLTSRLKWVKTILRNPLVSLIFVGFSHSRYAICISIFVLQRLWYMI